MLDENLKNKNRNFEHVVTITRPEPGENWKGHTGRIDADFLKENISDFKGSVYFLCGPKEFVYSAISILEGFGVAKEQIKTDVWG